MASLGAVGLPSSPGGAEAAIITSKLIGDGTSLIHVEFEINPLDSNVDQKVIVRGKPIEVVYDSQTITELVKCFTLPSDAKLSK